MSDELPVEAVERLGSLAAPSMAAVSVALVAMKRSVDAISADCRAVAETLHLLDDTLQVLSPGSGQGQEWGGFGVMGLPIVAAARAMRGVAGQHVRQRTGVSLDDWTDLVSDSSARFEAYMSQLDMVAVLSERYQASTKTEIDREQARHDEEVLLDLRWKTQAWKLILSHVAQLGQVVEALLQVNVGDGSEQSESERSSGFSSSVQGWLKDAQSRTVDRSSAVGEWVLRPLVEARDRVRELPRQVERLSHEVTLLEVLLELEIAEIRACLGEISPTEASLVGLRVAVGIILPEFVQDLTDARQRVESYETYLDRLDGAHSTGDVDDRAYSILSEEYRTGLDGSRSRLDALEAQAEVWRRDAAFALDACAAWADLQLDVLAARKVVEPDIVGADQAALLQRERERLNETKKLLASLSPQG